jgi:5-oxoprolinase (ATP-hydrolysing) subunit A
VLKFDEILPLYAPQNSIIFELAKGKIPVITEAFGDRNYEKITGLFPDKKSRL